MNAPTRPTRTARRLLTTSALTVTFVGAVAGGVALPVAAASAATPSPRASAPVSAPAPVPGDGRALPQAPAAADPSVPVAITRIPAHDGTPEQIITGPLPTAPGAAAPVQPRGGVDTGLGGSQPTGGHAGDVALPLGGAGLGALAGFGLWRRRRAGAR
ncbi:LPXTG cell wall anchor domain-containing protein, partial [Pseudofrankia saprophytica]